VAIAGEELRGHQEQRDAAPRGAPGERGNPAALAALQSAAGNQAVAAAMSKSPAAVAAMIDRVIAERVAALPEAEPSAIPDEGAVGAVRDEVQGAAPAVAADAGLPGPLQAFLVQEYHRAAPGGENDVAQVIEARQEAQEAPSAEGGAGAPAAAGIFAAVEQLGAGHGGGAAGVSAPPHAGPAPAPQGGAGPAPVAARSRWQGFKEGVGGVGQSISQGASSAWRGIKSGGTRAKNWMSSALGLDTREKRHDKGAKVAPIAGGVANEVSTWAHAPGATQDMLLTAGTSEVAGGQANSGATGLDASGHTSTWFGTVANGTLEVIHQVGSVVGIFFSAIRAALDVKSAWSSYKVSKALRAAEAQAASGNVNPVIRSAVQYAINQKYAKFKKRALRATLALATLGTAIAILVANPVGAALAASILAAIGLAWGLRRLFHWVRKKWWAKPGEGKGVARRYQSRQLYDGLVTNDPLARSAIEALHLDPNEVKAAGPSGGVDLIFRKLKSL
jgi:hypothetical protein